MERKQMEKIKADSIAESISKIQEICKYRHSFMLREEDRECVSEVEEKERLWFAIQILGSIPIPKYLKHTGHVLVSPTVTTRVIEDSYTLLRDRFETLKKKLREGKE